MTRRKLTKAQRRVLRRMVDNGDGWSSRLRFRSDGEIERKLLRRGYVQYGPVPIGYSYGWNAWLTLKGRAALDGTASRTRE